MTALLAVSRDENLAQVVLPVAHDLRELCLEVECVEFGLIARLRAHDHVHARKRRFVEQHGRVDAFATETLHQHRFDALADIGVEAVARHIGEHREKAPVAVAAHEQARARTFAQVEHGGRDVIQLVDRALEQFVARQRVEDMPQRLARMRIALEARAAKDRLQIASQHRYVARLGHVG